MPSSPPDRTGRLLVSVFAGALFLASPLAAQVPPPEDALTDGEQQAIRHSIQPCWNVGVLSTEALRQTVIVTFVVNPDRTPDLASIRTDADLSDPAIRQAFEAARSAIMRCSVRGFPLPPEKYEYWKELTLRFNLVEMLIQ